MFRALFVKAIRSWLPVAFAFTAAAALVYTAVQQSYRQSANDPQVEMAEDAAAAAENGTALQALVPSGSVNIAQSLAPYLIFYSATGTPIMGNGTLSGSLPDLPPGVFTYAASAGEDRFTWQPTSDIRQAVVVTYIAASGNGPAEFAMAGRSLRVVEIREDNLGFIIGTIWVAGLVGTLLIYIMLALAA